MLSRSRWASLRTWLRSGGVWADLRSGCVGGCVGFDENAGVDEVFKRE
ncbi:hypothetical protein NY049_02545 [Corynebacterium diphtheriae bv. gravis]|nr:hypothetical protein NY045_06005 [Corynebacterium diphtheriae bv. gravis]UWF10321.1 hypothetical protein NY049_02545 [Corynebacterium diphtheriae bv. gravis]